MKFQQFDYYMDMTVLTRRQYHTLISKVGEKQEKVSSFGARTLVCTSIMCSLTMLILPVEKSIMEERNQKLFLLTGLCYLN